jgi:hypothetical protein
MHALNELLLELSFGLLPQAAAPDATAATIASALTDLFTSFLLLAEQVSL